MTSVGIVLNAEKPETVEVGEKIFNWLMRQGIETYFLHSHAELIGISERGLGEEELVSASDFLISLGGDGTLLYTARLAAPSEKPILGVNLGDFGFLVAVEPENVYESLEKVLAGDYLCEGRMMLKSILYRGGRAVNTSYALNDVVITKGGFSRMIKLETFVAGEYVNNFPADGMIISSPTGSTGYSLSAGGPIVSPKVDVIILTPICPHTLYTRPLVISPEEQVRVILKTGSSEVMLTVDGQCGYVMEKGDEVVVEKAPFRTNLIRFPGRTFYESLREKLRKGERNG